MRKIATVILLLACIAGGSYFVYSDLRTQAQAGVMAPMPAPASSEQPGPGGPGGPGGFGGGHGFGGGGGRGGRMLTRLTTELSLTPAQVAKIKPILADERTKMMQIRNDSTLTDVQLKAQMAALRKSTNQLIKPILTPSQLATYKAMQAKMQSHQSGWGGGGGGQWGGGRPQGQ